MSQDWYRNTIWTPDVAQRFEEKLRRARSKDQYLRIQALCLVKSNPDVALSLIERFFARIKHFRRIATRYDKLAKSFLSFVHLACTFVWLA